MEQKNRTGGKELVRGCIKLLNVEQQVDGGSNRALYPVILVFFGDETQQFQPAVQDTLEDNWNNAKFLKYLGITKKEEGFLCRDLASGEESCDTDSFLEQAVVEMLATDEYVFENKNRVKFEFVLCGEDENAESYYRFMLELNRSHSYSVLKTLYLMMDESEREKKLKTRRLLAYITENRRQTVNQLGTIYLLSNYLKNGSMLMKSRLLLNYRLVADIILLGGNRGENGQKAMIQAVYQGDCLKTAAYALVEKPIRNIAIVSLLSLMEKLQEQGELACRQLPGRDFIFGEELKKRLGIQPGRIECLEEIFQREISRNLPKAEEISLLAYLSEKDDREIHQDKQASWDELDRRTGGNWSLFYEENYKKNAEKKLQEPEFRENCRKQITAEWKKQIGYLDALYGLKNGDILQVIEEMRVVSSVRIGNTLEETMHFKATAELKKLFYGELKPLLTEIILWFEQKAEELKENYENLMNEVRQEDMDDRVQKKSIQRYYENVVDMFLKKDEGRCLKEIFQLEYSRGELEEAIKGLFGRLIKDNPVYGYSFEKELEERMDGAGEQERMLMVTNELEQNIEDYGRLHWNQFTYTNQTRGTYYLVNRKADYAKKLKDNSSEYSLFHLNRADCIEKIAIYDLDTKNGYCNLTEMAGEVT